MASPAYATTVSYDSAGNLSKVTDPAGRTLTVTWTGSHITQIADSAGRVVSYGYDAAGNLSDVYGVGTTRSPSLKDDDHTVFTYTATHLMATMRGPRAYGVTATSSPVVSMTWEPRSG